MKYHFKKYKEKDGFWAECVELNGCVTQAISEDKLEKNMQEALNLFLSEPESSDFIFPLPRPAAPKNLIKVEVRPEVSLAMLLRQMRVKSGLTQHQMKDALGIRHLSQYQKLENPNTSNPQLKTLAKIKKRFPEFPIEKVF